MNFIPRFWLIPFTLFIVPNLLWYGVFIESGIITEKSEISTHIDFIDSFICIFTVILTFLFSVYCAQLGARQLHKNKQDNLIPVSIGKLVFILQLIGFLNTLIFDFGRVGGVNQSDDIFLIIFSYIPIDSIFLVYYGHQRSKCLPFSNLVLFIISNSIRGWSGIWSMLFLIESYYAWRSLPIKKLLSRLLLTVIIGFLIFPIVNKFKDDIRGTVSIEDDSFFESSSKLTYRLEQIMNILLIKQEQNNISTALINNQILPFYADNKIGSLIFRDSHSIQLQKFLTINYMINFNAVGNDIDQDSLGWFSHVGIAGWLYIIDWYIWPIYFLYIAGIIIIPYWLAARFIGVATMIPIFHMMTIIYVFHGWLSMQISFIYGVIWYVFLYKSIKWLLRQQKIQKRN